MQTQQEFYICPTCFYVSETHPESHEHEMLHYPGYPAGHQQLKPPVDDTGNLKTEAPSWFATQKLATSATNTRGDWQTTNISDKGEMVEPVMTA
jgi:hypothetical protein